MPGSGQAPNSAGVAEQDLTPLAVSPNGFSNADPSDPGMLDVVGFDTATPQLVSDLARGAL
jgi:60 kDa SS-A/Ro ribonucleoprotein